MIYPDRLTALALADRRITAAAFDGTYLGGACLLHVTRDDSGFRFERESITDFPIRKGEDPPRMGCTRETISWLGQRLRPDHALVGWRPDLSLAALFRAAREDRGAAEVTPALQAVEAALSLDPVTVADVAPNSAGLEYLATTLGLECDHLAPAVRETAWLAGDMPKLARSLEQEAETVWWTLTAATLPMAEAARAAAARRTAEIA